MDGGVAGFAQATTPHQTSGIKTSLLSQERISGKRKYTNMLVTYITVQVKPTFQADSKKNVTFQVLDVTFFNLKD